MDANDHITKAQLQAKRGVELSRHLNFENAFEALSASGEELLVAAKCCSEEKERSQAILMEASRIISMAEDIKVLIKGPSARRIKEAVQMYESGLNSELQSKRKYALYYYIKSVEIMLPIASLIKKESPRSYKYLDRAVVDIMQRAERLKRMGICPSQPSSTKSNTTIVKVEDEDEKEENFDKSLHTVLDGVYFPKELVLGTRTTDYDIHNDTKYKTMCVATHRATKTSAAIVRIRVGKDLKLLAKTAARIRKLHRVMSSNFGIQCVRTLQSCTIEGVGDMKEVVCVFSGDRTDEEDQKWIPVSTLSIENMKNEEDKEEEDKGGEISEWHAQSIFRSIISTCVVLHAHSIFGFVGPHHIYCDVNTSSVNLCPLKIPISVMKTLPCAAPEIQTGSKATEMSDMWTIGFLLYRFYFNKDPVLMGEKITFPKGGRDFAGDRVCNLLENLLRSNPAERLRATEAQIAPFFTTSLVVDLVEDGKVLELERKREALFELIEIVREASKTRRLYMNITRRHIVDTAINAIMKIPKSDLTRRMSVRFQGESGVDAGGLTTELYHLFFSKILSVSCPLFVRIDDVDNPTFLPAVDKETIWPQSARLFIGFGRFLVKAIFDGQPVPCPLSSACFKFLLNREPNMSDLASYDPRLAQSLRQILELDDAEDLMLDFGDAGGDENRDVTNENREEYVKAKIRFVLFESRKRALEKIKEGFEAIKISAHLKLFSCTELMSIACGVRNMSGEDVISCLTFSGFASHSNTPKHLKALLRKMSKSELQKFLIFITAQSALPTGTKKIRISKTSSTSSCPVAHTCFNRLDLPDYNDKETLSRMLRISLDNLDAGFGLA